MTSLTRDDTIMYSNANISRVDTRLPCELGDDIRLQLDGGFLRDVGPLVCRMLERPNGGKSRAGSLKKQGRSRRRLSHRPAGCEREHRRGLLS